MIAAMQTKGHGRGKSGLRRAGCQITSGGGNSRDSATEIYRVSNEAGDWSWLDDARLRAIRHIKARSCGECRVTRKACFPSDRLTDP